jgi:hypothetical protein
MNMRDGTVVSEKMEPVVPNLVCRDVKITKRRFSPSNGGTFTASGSEIRIPISGNFVLDNKNVNLNFNVQTSAAGAIDFSPAGFFSQVRVEAGTGSSIVLESINPLIIFLISSDDIEKSNGLANPFVCGSYAI